MDTGRVYTYDSMTNDKQISTLKSADKFWYIKINNQPKNTYVLTSYNSNCLHVPQIIPYLPLHITAWGRFVEE